MTEETVKQASIVSVFPHEFRENKPGLHPGNFHILAAESLDDPSITIINPSRYNIYLGENRNFSVDVPAYEVAKSLVADLVGSMVEYDIDAHAGLIAVDGILTSITLKTKFNEQLTLLKSVQERWFRKLVDLADKDWSRTKSPMAVSDLQRTACKLLGLSKEWSETSEARTVIECIACRSLIPSDSIICKNCKTVLNPEAYKRFQTAVSV
jgi:hypothetical protein